MRLTIDGPTPDPANCPSCSRCKGSNNRLAAPGAKPTPLSRTNSTVWPRCDIAPTSIRGCGAPRENFTALASRFTNTWRSRPGSTVTAGSGSTVTGHAVAGSAPGSAPGLAPRSGASDSPTTAAVSSARGFRSSLPARASASSEVTSSADASACADSRPRKRFVSSCRPSSSAGGAGRAAWAKPPSGPRRSCDTLRLKLSSPATLLPSSAVRSATRCSSESLRRRSSASAWRRRSTSACAAARSRICPVVSTVMPSITDGTMIT